MTVHARHPLRPYVVLLAVLAIIACGRGRCFGRRENAMEDITDYPIEYEAVPLKLGRYAHESNYIVPQCEYCWRKMNVLGDKDTAAYWICTACQAVVSMTDIPAPKAQPEYEEWLRVRRMKTTNATSV